MIDFTITEEDKKLSEFVNTVKEESKTNDILHNKLRVLECVSHNGTLYENSVLERLSEEIENTDNSMVDYSEDIPLITPWFTPDEMRDQFNIEVDPYEYILKGKSTMSFHENLRKAMYDLSIAKERSMSVEEATNNIIKLGWNPSVPYNETTMKYARDRQIKWFNENKPITIVDISDFDIVSEDTKPAIVKLEPVYITLINHEGINSKVIQWWTKSNWSHAGFSFDEKLDHIYSFNGETPDGRRGFGIESLDFYKKAKNPNMKVLTFFVEPKIKEKLKKTIEFFIKNKNKTSYSFKNIANIVLNKTTDSAYSLSMVCSQFVDSILKIVNIDLTGKPSNLVTPSDFERSAINNKLFTIFTGKVNELKSSMIKKKVMKLLSSDLNPEGLIIKPLGEITTEILKNKNIDYIYTESNNEKINLVLREIREILYPTSVIVEAKPLPIRFGKSGNMFIELPRDLELEYQEAHRLLNTYSEKNIEGIKHQLARLFYINSIIEKKIKKMKKDDNEYKELIDLRARVINDFKKYMTIVQNTEENFDFEQYMKNSEYYNKTVMIDKHTMKYSGKLIKDMIKIMK